MHLGTVVSQERRAGGHHQALPGLRDGEVGCGAGLVGASSQRKGAETSPWPRSRTHSATWLRGQHSREGPEAGSGEHQFLGGRGQWERGALQEKPGGATFPRGQSWTLGQSRLQRERPEAGTGPESQG